MCTVAADEKCPITPLYVGMNQSTKIVNILYYKNDQISHYAFIGTLVGSSTVQQRVTSESLSVLTAPVPTSTHRRHSTITWRKSTLHQQQFICEKCLNVFHTQEAKEFHDSICMVKENELQVVEYPAYDKPIRWEEKDNAC